MQRYFIHPSAVKNHVVTVVGDDAHHIRDVMRMHAGRQIELVIDGDVYLGVIQSTVPDGVEVEIVRGLDEEPKALPVTLALALIRKTPFEYALQKCVELGIDAFVPLRMRHCVVKIPDDRATKKTMRYQSIAKEASEQCKRTSIPHVARPMDLRSLDDRDYDEILVPYERTRPEESLRKHLRRTGTDRKRLVIIGPEGGFAPEEVDYLLSKNAVFVSLGRTVLRAETAAVYTIGGIRYEHE